MGADGANSAVRKLSGLSTWGWGYGQEAVVATVRLPGYPVASFTKPATEPPFNTSPATDGAAGDVTGKPGAGAGAGADGVNQPHRAPNQQEPERGGRDRVFKNDTAWQKYLPTGPLALLPLWNGYASIVWSTSVADAKRLKALPEEQFLVELNAALQTPPATDKWSVFEKSDAANLPPFLNNLFQGTSNMSGPLGGALQNGPFQLLQRVKKEVAAVADVMMSAAQMKDPLQYPPSLEALCGPRVSFPLNFSQASAYTAQRCALVGDAAHSIHPQAGQGLNLGIQDAMTLSDNIVRTLKTGGDIGNAAMLRDYEQERYVKNLGMMSLVDGINRVFRDSSGAYPASSNVRPNSSSSSSSSQHAHAGSGQSKSESEEKFNGEASAGYEHEAEQRQEGRRSNEGGEKFGQSGRKSTVSALPKTKQFLRSAGMLGIHQLGPIKHRIAKFAMGIDDKGSK